MQAGAGYNRLSQWTGSHMDCEEVNGMKLCIQIRPNGQGGFTAVCPSLPGCTSRGQTPQEAEKRLDEAIRGYIAAVSNFVPEHVPHEVVEA